MKEETAELWFFPDAQLKIYLTASQVSRGKRRALEKRLKSKDVLDDHKKRDLRDMQRKIAPLKMTKDAYLIDTTQIDIDTTVRLVLDLFH